MIIIHLTTSIVLQRVVIYKGVCVVFIGLRGEGRTDLVGG